MKAELLKVVDGEAEKPPVLEKVDEKKAEEAPKVETAEEETGDWRSSIKGQMSEAEEKAKAEEERKKHEAETAVETVDFTEEMTEADCRELWRILQGLEREFRDMKDIASDWFTVHGKGNGCMGALAVMTLLPVGVIYGVWQVL